MSENHPFLAKIYSHKIDSKALIYDDFSLNFGELAQEIHKKTKLLESVPKGSCVGILGDFNPQSIAFLLGNLNRQNIIAPFANKNEIESKLESGQIDFLFENGELKRLNSRPKAPKHELIQALQKSKANGLILFSSGSTGKPKAVVHNLDSLLTPYLAKKPKNINILLFLMFDHIGGLNTLFNALALGACGVAISERKDVELLARTLQDYKIFMLPASPSLLNLMLLADVQNKFDLSTLRLITYGTEKMPDALLTRLKTAFPKARFHQTFGTSEVGITQTTTHENAIKLENIEYKIKNGELFLRSNHQALGYLNADNNAFDNEGYFATGDLVEVVRVGNDEYLRILGRTKEVINVGGEKVLPQEVENVILAIPFIKDCLVFGEQNSILGQSVSVQVVLCDGLDFDNLALKKQIRLFCKDKLANYKIPTKVEIVDDLKISERFKKVRNLASAKNHTKNSQKNLKESKQNG